MSLSHRQIVFRVCLKNRSWLGFALLLMALLLCANSPAQTLQRILPSQTDSNIVQFNNYHYVYLNTNVPPRPQLFVLLSGTGGAPAFYQDVLQTAANLGFHAAGLMYDNGVTMNSLCGDSTNPDCYVDARLATINGGTNDGVSVPNPESITNRLVKLLEFLATNNPDQNWGQFLTAQTNLNWPQIIIAGHSQGAGHAGLIAKIYPVSRSLMFDDTDWWTPGGKLPGQPANWIVAPGVTSAEFYFGFVHVQDALIPYAEEIPTWNDYGLAPFGAPTLVESNLPPYSGSHMLTTDLPPQNGTTGLDYHDATVVDNSTPLAADGVTPVYQPVWQYMLVEPPELPQLSLTPVTANQIQLSFGTFTNYNYQVQAATNLTGGWSDVDTTMPGDGSIKTISLTNSAAAQFYRVTVTY